MRKIVCDYKECDEEIKVSPTGIVPQGWTQYIISRIHHGEAAEIDFCPNHKPEVLNSLEKEVKLENILKDWIYEEVQEAIDNQ